MFFCFNVNENGYFVFNSLHSKFMFVKNFSKNLNFLILKKNH